MLFIFELFYFFERQHTFLIFYIPIIIILGEFQCIKLNFEQTSSSKVMTYKNLKFISAEY